MKHLAFLCLSALLLLPGAAQAGNDPVDNLASATQSRLQSHSFDALDAMGDKLRRTDARFPGGDSELRMFYEDAAAFDAMACGCDADKTRITFEQRKADITAWLGAKPQSLTAHVAMAELLINAAWTARTGNYSDKVSDAQWALFRERLTEAGTYLDIANRKDDPHIYSEMIEIALADSNPRPLLDALYAEATKKYPRHFHFYSDRVERLQEKWFGEPGELAAYTKSLLTSPGGDDGEVAYTFVATRLSLLYYYTPGYLFTETGLSWPEVKKAFAVRERLYGLSYGNWNTLLFLAQFANDPKSGAEYVRHIGNYWTEAYWKNQAGFDAAVHWSQSVYGLRPPDFRPH